MVLGADGEGRVIGTGNGGLSGLLAILVFMPYLNILFVIGLGFVPGTPGPNAYGPWPNGRWARPK